MTNSTLKRKLIFAKNQELLNQYKSVKEAQERLLLALNDSIACIFKNEDEPRQEISRKDYRRALNHYIDEYVYLLGIKNDIKQLQNWEVND